MTKETIYLYTKEQTEKIDTMITKYQRYQTKMEEIKLSDGIIYKIDCTRTKQYRIKDFIYLIKDTGDNMIDLLGDYLIN
jgi:hypothetical protein